jgi:hypothetical protein
VVDIALRDRLRMSGGRAHGCGWRDALSGHADAMTSRLHEGGPDHAVSPVHHGTRRSPNNLLPLWVCDTGGREGSAAVKLVSLRLLLICPECTSGSWWPSLLTAHGFSFTALTTAAPIPKQRSAIGRRSQHQRRRPVL